MNPDLHMADELKNTGGGNLFVVFGEPDIGIENASNDEIQVRIKGVDVFHPQTGKIESGGPDSIAVWFIDTELRRRKLFRPPRLFSRRERPVQSAQNHAQSRNRPRSLAKPESRQLAPLPPNWKNTDNRSKCAGR